MAFEKKLPPEVTEQGMQFTGPNIPETDGDADVVESTPTNKRKLTPEELKRDVYALFKTLNKDTSAEVDYSKADDLTYQMGEIVRSVVDGEFSVEEAIHVAEWLDDLSYRIKPGEFSIREVTDIRNLVAQIQRLVTESAKSNSSQEVFYQDSVTNSTNVGQLFKHYSKAEKYGLNPNPEVSKIFLKLKDSFIPILENKEVRERNLKWAQDLSNTVIRFMENALPDGAKEVLPEDWEQVVIRYFVEKTQGIPENVSYEDLCRRLGLGSYDTTLLERLSDFKSSRGWERFLDGDNSVSSKPSTFSSVLVPLLGASYDGVTGVRTAYAPSPYYDSNAFEEWSEMYKKINKLSKNLADAIRITVPSEQEKIMKTLEEN